MERAARKEGARSMTTPSPASRDQEGAAGWNGELRWSRSGTLRDDLGSVAADAGSAWRVASRVDGI